MGLDMYLTKRHYVKQWDHQTPEEKFEVSVTRGGNDYPQINPSKVKYIEEEAAYWRKANAIHGWFVENVQDGIDECQESYVNPRQIEELLCACKEVLENSNKATEILPTSKGFFFGSTDYDEWYLQDLEHTAIICAELLEDLNEDGHWPYDLTYQSSW